MVTVYFEETKHLAAGATPFANHVPIAQLGFVGTSKTGRGAVLHQLVAGVWQQLGFFSNKLESTQTLYSMYDWELLPIYKGIKRYRFQLEGCTFTIFTDHGQKDCSPRHLRQLKFIAQFTTDVRHIPGSRKLTHCLRLKKICQDNFDLIADMQTNNLELRELLSSTSTLLKLECHKLPLCIDVTYFMSFTIRHIRMSRRLQLSLLYVSPGLSMRSDLIVGL